MAFKVLSNEISLFLKACWHEVEPISKHGFVSGSIAMIVAGLTWLCEKILPSDYILDLHYIEHALFKVLLGLFGLFVVLSLLTRLARHFWRVEIRDGSNWRELEYQMREIRNRLSQMESELNALKINSTEAIIEIPQQARQAEPEPANKR